MGTRLPRPHGVCTSPSFVHQKPLPQQRLGLCVTTSPLQKVPTPEHPGSHPCPLPSLGSCAPLGAGRASGTGGHQHGCRRMHKERGRVRVLPAGPKTTPQLQRAGAWDEREQSCCPHGDMAATERRSQRMGSRGAAGAGGCPEAWQPPGAAEAQGRFAGRFAGRGSQKGLLQGGCTYRWVRAASGRIARGHPPGRGAGRGHRRPTPAGRTPGAAGHSPSSGDTMLLWGQEKTGQEEERGQMLPWVCPWHGTQLSWSHLRRAGPTAANGCGWALPELPLGPALPLQSHY